MRGGKETIVVAGFFLLIIFSVLFFINRSMDNEEYFPPRTSYSPKTTGYKALYELLDATGFEVSRYAGNEYHYPESGCVILGDANAADPSAMFGLGLDTKQIKGWLEEGGSLVLISSVEYFSLGRQVFDELDGNALEGFFELMEDIETYDHTSSDDESELVTPVHSIATYASDGDEGNIGALFSEYLPGQIFELDENRPAIWNSVEKIEIADQYIEYGINGSALLMTDSNIPVVVYREVGAGEIFLVVSPEIMSNEWIDRQDNHRFALALIDRAARGGPVVFDEHLNGYREKGYNAGSLITKTTGGRLMMLFALAVVVMFLGQAIRPALFHPQKVLPRRQASEMVLAQASLYRRALLQSSIASRLVDGLKRSYMNAHHLATPPSLDELAEAIETSPDLHTGVDPVLLDYLKGTATPASPDGLFRLAKACYQLQLRLG